MNTSPVRTTAWKIWLVIGVISITGGVVSQKTGSADVKLTPSHSDVEKYVSSSHFVSCTGPRGVRMKWMRNSTEVTATKGRIHIEANGAHPGIALVFENIDTQDKGIYTCKAVVDSKEVQASFRLTVMKPIKFVDTVTRQTASLYQSVVVRCDAEGDPEPIIKWTVNGKVPEGPKYKVVADGLYINNVTLEDKGEYTCRAFQLSPTISNMLERIIVLKIEHKPVWREKEEPAKAYAFITGNVNLTCEVTAEPAPKFEWLKANETLTSQQNVTIFEEEFHTILQLQVNSENDFGDYVCKASNRLGKVERVITLLKSSKPAVPETSIREARHDSVKIDIEGPENEELGILGYRVQYIRRQELKKGWNSAKVVEFDKGESPYSISGLRQNTHYIMRVASRNAAGFSDYTKESSFTTDKIHADPVTGSASTATYVSSGATQIIGVIVLHHIVAVTVELKHNL
ncbi:opioid-binding protein/cell adhesion molecule [Cryptotermes secundus]|nr:opioid-binding protein/cell adhesion molecule [Cryptotermes secundus]